MHHRPHNWGGYLSQAQEEGDGIGAVEERLEKKKTKLVIAKKEKNLVKNTYFNPVYLTDDFIYELDVYKADGEYKGEYFYGVFFKDISLINYSNKVYLRLHLVGYNGYILLSSIQILRDTIQFSLEEKEYDLLTKYPIKLIQVRDWKNTNFKSFYSKKYRHDPQPWFIALADGVDNHYNIL